MESNKEEQITTVSEENIYKLNGKVGGLWPRRKKERTGVPHTANG